MGSGSGTTAAAAADAAVGRGSAAQRPLWSAGGDVAADGVGSAAAAAAADAAARRRRRPRRPRRAPDSKWWRPFYARSSHRKMRSVLFTGRVCF